MPALGVRCLYSHKWNLTPKLCSFGTWHSFLEKSMLNGGTLIQANQGQIKAFKKAMYDYETPTNRFFGSKLVEFNMPYVSRAILWIGPEKSTVGRDSSPQRAVEMSKKMRHPAITFSALRAVCKSFDAMGGLIMMAWHALILFIPKNFTRLASKREKPEKIRKFFFGNFGNIFSFLKSLWHEDSKKPSHLPISRRLIIAK